MDNAVENGVAICLGRDCLVLPLLLFPPTPHPPTPRPPRRWHACPLPFPSGTPAHGLGIGHASHVIRVRYTLIIRKA
jgi:hypothetical protein